MRPPSSPAFFSAPPLFTALALILPFVSGAAPTRAEAPPVTVMTPEMHPAYQSVRPEADYIRREVMIPMRDGKKLFTVIVMRKGTAGGPILLSRTPYNATGATTRNVSQSITEILPVMDAVFVNDGYIRVYQDIRGLQKSEGDFVMNRPLNGTFNDTGVDEATDAYDTVDWLVKNVPETNGKVAITGSSYLGFTSLMATVNAHPALKAAVPQSPMVDGWMGDDWFHNGAFRQVNFNYFTEMTTTPRGGGPIPAGARDDYVKFLEAGSAGDYARKWGVDVYPFVQKLMQNPAYSEFWSIQAVDKELARFPLTVPTLLVVGQWDQEDSYGAPAVFKALEPKDTQNDKLYFAIGPWRHSQTNYEADSLGLLKYPGDTAMQFRVQYMKPFLDHYLKDAPDPHIPPVITYETGVNRWQGSQTWDQQPKKALYLQSDFNLSFTRPAGKDAPDAYISDPAKPIPFLPRPINMDDANQWKPWLVHDQRFVSDRTDVLVYQTPVLDQPVHIMGQPMVDLFASTTGTDGDFVVKLIDVYPEEDSAHPETAGLQLAVGLEIFRGRYVHGFDKPQALTPGKVEEYRFGLPHVNHTFLPGHRIMVQVQSSLFPLYDRNPQSFVPNIFDAKPGDYKKATISVHHSAAYPSSIQLPVAAQ